MNLKTLGTAIFAALALAAAQAGAQEVYKCQNAAGKVTYASQECDKLGMRSAGEVKNSINVAPAQKAPPTPPAPAVPARAAQAEPPKAEPTPEQERRCFRVKTAKGFATRCNDKPDEPE